MRCQAGPGTCRIDCDGGCGCVYVWAQKSCVCDCFESVHSGQMNLNAATRVDVSIAGLPLGHVATMLDGLLARDVLVPASRMQEKVRLKLERVTLSHAVKELGLRTQRPVAPRKPVARSKRTT
jgi:hypothetical protein